MTQANEIPKLRYKRFTIDTITWTPITAPIDCNQVVLLNEGIGDAVMRTDATDASTEKNLMVGVQEIMQGREKSAPHRWYNGAIILYVQAVTGTGPIHGSFLL